MRIRNARCLPLAALLLCACRPEYSIAPERAADVVWIAELDAAGRLSATRRLESGKPIRLELGQSGFLLLYELSLDEFRNRFGREATAEDLERVRLEATESRASGCEQCLDFTQAPPIKLIPGSACPPPDWLTSAAYVLDDPIERLDPAATLELGRRAQPQLRLRVEGECPCEVVERDPEQLRFERVYPPGPTEVPLEKTVDPRSSAVAMWFVDRLELAAPGGRRARLSLEAEVALSLQPGETTAYPCPRGFDACFAAVLQGRLLRVEWSFEGDAPTRSEQALPPEVIAERASPSAIPQAGSEPGEVLVRTSRRLIGSTAEWPQVVLCSPSQCIEAHCEEFRDVRRNVPARLWPSQDGAKWVTFARDRRLVELQTRPTLSMSCRDLSSYDWSSESGALVPRHFGPVHQTGSGALFVSFEGGFLGGIAIAPSLADLDVGRVVIPQDLAALGLVASFFEHPAHADRVLFRRVDAPPLWELTEAGLLLGALIPERSSAYAPDGLAWPRGTRDLYRTRLGHVADTHVGLEWVPDSGPRERLWGGESSWPTRGGMRVLAAGDGLALLQPNEALNGTEVFFVDLSAQPPQVRGPLEAPLILSLRESAGIHAYGSTHRRSMRYLRWRGYPDGLFLEELDLDTGEVSTHSVDTDSLGLGQINNLMSFGALEDDLVLLYLGLERSDRGRAVVWSPGGALRVIEAIDSDVRLASKRRNSDGGWLTRSDKVVGRVRAWWNGDELQASYAEAESSALSGGSQGLTALCAGSSVGLALTGTRDRFFWAREGDPPTIGVLDQETAVDARYIDPGRRPMVFAQGAGDRRLFRVDRAAPFALAPVSGPLEGMLRARDGRLVVFSDLGDVFVELR